LKAGYKIRIEKGGTASFLTLLVTANPIDLHSTRMGCCRSSFKAMLVVFAQPGCSTDSNLTV